jgi:DNA-binding response OmpR family regulator
MPLPTEAHGEYLSSRIGKSMTASILLIEKAESPIDWIPRNLEKKGYEVSLAGNEQEAVQLAISETPDLIILNATSRRLDGPGICRALQKKVAEIPIILILAKGQESDDSAGATVILTPPLTSRKLFNRIRSILKSDEGEALQAGKLTLNLGTRHVSSGGKEQKLTPKEFELLKVFMRSPGRVLSRKFLMKKVWKTDYIGDTRTLDVHICWLREKIEKNPSMPVYLRTVRAVGYRFDTSEEANEETERET